MYTGVDQRAAADEAPDEAPNVHIMERISVMLSRVRRGYASEGRAIAAVLPVPLLDFFPTQQVMSLLMGEFVSDQQANPEHVAWMLGEVFGQLLRAGQQPVLRDWVLLSLEPFVRKEPVALCIWHLACLFIAASRSAALRALCVRARAARGAGRGTCSVVTRRAQLSAGRGAPRARRTDGLASVLRGRPGLLRAAGSVADAAGGLLRDPRAARQRVAVCRSAGRVRGTGVVRRRSA